MHLLGQLGFQVKVFCCLVYQKIDLDVSRLLTANSLVQPPRKSDNLDSRFIENLNELTTAIHILNRRFYLALFFTQKN